MDFGRLSTIPKKLRNGARQLLPGERVALVLFWQLELASNARNHDLNVSKFCCITHHLPTKHVFWIDLRQAHFAIHKTSHAMHSSNAYHDLFLKKKNNYYHRHCSHFCRVDRPLALINPSEHLVLPAHLPFHFHKRYYGQARSGHTPGHAY